MNIFRSEQDIIEALNMHDELVFQCVNGEIDFWTFCEKYHDFYWYYALDGHESDEAEQQILLKHEKRIEPHRIIAELILSGVCTDKDMKNPLYPQAGRFGSDIAMEKLRQVAKEHMKWNGQPMHPHGRADARR